MNSFTPKALVFGYVFSSLTLSGIPGWSLLSFLFFAALSVALGAYLLSGRLIVGNWIVFPIVFVLHCGLLTILVSETALDAFMTTLVAWGGAIAVALAVVNAVPLRTVLVAMVLASAANVIAVLYGFDAYIAYSTNLNTEPEESLLMRPSGLVGNPNLLAIQAMLPIFALTLWKEHGSKLLWIVAIACGLFVLLVSGSRKGLMLLIALLIFAAVAYRSRRAIGAFMLFCAVLSAIGFVLWTVLAAEVDAPGTYGVLALTRMALILQGGDESLGDRTNFWNIGWSVFSQSPIWGYGLDTFRRVSGTGFYSHINQIELLVAGGILLFCNYYALYVAAFLRARNAFRRDDPRRTGYWMFLSVLFLLDFTMVSYNVKIISLILVLLLANPYRHARPRALQKPHWPSLRPSSRVITPEKSPNEAAIRH